jgi:hypothetical protein
MVLVSDSGGICRLVANTGKEKERRGEKIDGEIKGDQATGRKDTEIPSALSFPSRRLSQDFRERRRTTSKHLFGCVW